MRTDTEWLKGLIRDVPDHPAPGVTFRDITPLLGDPKAFTVVVDALVEAFAGAGVDHVVGVEARGFILAAPVAHGLRAGFVPVRKPGKLPVPVLAIDYALEYGTDTLEVDPGAVADGQRFVLVDDLIATGGTAVAAVTLLCRAGARVQDALFVIDLPGLGGAARLREAGLVVESLMDFPGH